jgi:hypothetical protein
MTTLFLDVTSCSVIDAQATKASKKLNCLHLRASVLKARAVISSQSNLTDYMASNPIILVRWIMLRTCGCHIDFFVWF